MERTAFAILGLAVLIGAATRLPGEDAASSEEGRAIRCHILYRAGGGVYVDLGSSARLEEGASGRLERDGGEFVRIEVAEVASDSAFLRAFPVAAIEGIEPGETVTLVVDRLAAPPASRREKSASLRDREAEGDEFVPLLAPEGEKVIAYSEPENVFHGRLWFRQRFQKASDEHDASVTRFGSSGRLERIEGTPWGLEWSGELSYATGDVFNQTRFENEVRLEARELALFRRFDDRSFLRIGRFLPLELPSAGYIDGVQGEKRVTDSFRLGGMFGFRPTRDDLDVSFDEIASVLYGAFEVGDPNEMYWTVTLGVLSTLWEGTPDRLAFLADQRADLGRFSILSSTEVDFDVGGAIAREGVRLTREDLLLTYQATDTFELRAGFDRYELPDNEGERSVIQVGALEIEEFFLDEFSRYWAGASKRLPWGLRIDGEVAYTDSEIDDGIRGSASLTRVGLPGLPSGAVTISAYRLEGFRSEGYGGRVSFHLPFADGVVIVQPAVGFRYAEFDTIGSNFFDPVNEELTVVDASLRVLWSISRRWQLSAGCGWTGTDDESAIFADIGASFRW